MLLIFCKLLLIIICLFNSGEKFIKDETTSSYESPPKKSLKSLNNINNYTNGSTAMFSSNRASKLNNLMISNK